MKNSEPNRPFLEAQPKKGGPYPDPCPATRSATRSRDPSDIIGKPRTASATTSSTRPPTSATIGNPRTHPDRDQEPRTQPMPTNCSIKCHLGHDRTNADRDQCCSDKPTHTNCLLKCLLGCTRINQAATNISPDMLDIFSATDHDTASDPDHEPITEPRTSRCRSR